MLSKINTVLIAGLLSTIFLLACTNQSHRQPSKKTIAVSILPQKYFIDKLAGEHYNTIVMLPQGANHETFEPTAVQLTDLSRASAYFYLGHLAFEQALLKGLRESNTQVQFVDCSKNVKLLEGACDHGHEADHAHGVDPHTWISPTTVKEMIKVMVATLSEIDPSFSDSLKINSEKLYKQIDSLDSVLRETVKSSKTKGVMLFHPILSYMARDYGFEQFSIENEGKEPSPQELKSVIEKARKANIKVIFVQMEFDTQRAKIVADEVGATVVMLDPLGYYWNQNIASIINHLAKKQ